MKRSISNNAISKLFPGHHAAHNYRRQRIVCVSTGLKTHTECRHVINGKFIFRVYYVGIKFEIFTFLFQKDKFDPSSPYPNNSLTAIMPQATISLTICYGHVFSEVNGK